MKVAMLCLYPQYTIIGGVQEHIYRLTRSIEKNNDDVDLDIISFGYIDQCIKRGSLKIIFIKRKWYYYFFPPLAVIKLYRIVLSIDPDIIHVQGSNISPYLICSLLFRSDKCKKVITVHGVMQVESSFKKGYEKIFSKLFEKYAVSKIPNIIVCSKSSQKIIGQLSTSKLYIVPNGVDLDYVKHIIPEISLKTPNILFVGVLRKIKGIDILLNSIPLIKKSIPNIQVYIAGNGPYEQELKSLSQKLDIESNVHFLGYVEGQKKYSYYKSTDLLVLPSRYDNAPLVLIEAMACGIPVVASNIGGIPDVVLDSKTGLLFEPDNIEDLSTKIIYLLQNDNIRKKMGENARDNSVLYDWNKIAESTIAVYKQLMNDTL